MFWVVERIWMFKGEMSLRFVVSCMFEHPTNANKDKKIINYIKKTYNSIKYVIWKFIVTIIP